MASNRYRAVQSPVPADPSAGQRRPPTERAVEQGTLASLGTLLRLHRRRAGLTQEELAEQAGFSPEYIRKLEGGTRRPTIASLQVLVEALDLDPAGRSRLLEARAAWATTATARPKAPAGSPRPISSFVGRQRELAEIRSLLTSPEVRIVTLTGTGGAGKTRLALEISDRPGAAFPGGIFLAELAPLSESSYVLPTLRRAVGAEQDTAGDLAAIAEALTRKPALLVVDNLEHVLDAGCDLLEIARCCPSVTLLITSRIALRVPGEHVYHVPPMMTPHDRAQVAEVMDFDAVRLFAERALEARNDFCPAAGDWAVIGEICRRLDGLPLSIELAAAATRLVSPAQLLLSLQSQGPLQPFPSGNRLAPERHQSLERSLEWSFRLLQPDAQLLFGPAGIFVEGGTLEALSAVGELPPHAFVAALAELIDGCLLHERSDGQGRARYFMLPTIREYALSKLGGEGRAVAADRHAAFFLSLADDLYPDLNGPERARVLDRLEVDRDNIAAAIHWLVISGRREDAARLAGNVWTVWHDRGFRQQGRTSLMEALPASSKEDTPGDIRALRGAAVLAFHSPDATHVEALLWRALAQARATDDPVELFHTLRALSSLAELRGDATGMLRFSSEALEIAERTGDEGLVARAAGDAGAALLGEDRSEEAEPYVRRSIAAARASGLHDLLIIGLGNLAWILRQSGRGQEADAAAREAYEVGANEGGAWPRAVAAMNLGGILTGSAEGAALPYLRQALAIFQGLDEPEDQLFTCELLALAEACRGRDHRAARIWGATQALRRSFGLPGLAGNRSQWEGETERARDRLGSDAWDVEWQAGGSLSLDELVSMALEAHTDLQS